MQLELLAAQRHEEGERAEAAVAAAETKSADYGDGLAHATVLLGDYARRVEALTVSPGEAAYQHS